MKRAKNAPLSDVVHVLSLQIGTKNNKRSKKVQNMYQKSNLKINSIL
ncbi:hypothetical protein [Candidatus Mesenet endosymbiont of Agriotes lineatus]